MRLRNILYATVATLTLAACSNNEKDNFVATALNVQANIAGTTRVASGQFEVGDAIGIFVASTKTDGLTSGDNVKYVAINTAADFTSDDPIYYKDVNDVNIAAYYPYSASLTNGTLLVKIDDQTDYLFAEKDGVKYDSEGVELVFNHIMSQFTVKVKAGVGIESLDALKSVTLKSISSEGTFDAKDGSLTATASADYELKELTDNEDGSKSATALVFPVAGEKEISLVVNYNDAEYKATLTAKSGLAANTSYTYTVTVTRTGLTVGGSSISPWVEGDDLGEGSAVIPE
jgi:hypothetical protein